MFTTTMSEKGEVVIPQPIREKLGVSKKVKVFLDLKGDVIELRTAREDPIKVMEECARRINADVSKWVMGDRLYEEEFGRDFQG